MAFDVLIYSLGDVLLKGLLFLTLPIYTRLFSPTEYGALSALLVLVSLVTSVLLLGGDSAYARFFFSVHSERDRQELTTSWVGFLAAFSVLGAGVLAPLALPFSRAFLHGRDTWAFAIAIMGIPPALVNDILGQGLRNQFRRGAFVGTNLLIAAVDVGASVTLVTVGHLGVAGVFAGTAIGEVATLPVRGWLLRHLFTRRISRFFLRPLLRYGVPLVPASVSYWIFTVSDRLILARLTTLATVGLYSAANAVVGIVSLLNGAMAQAWSPRATRLYEDRPDEARTAFGAVMLALLTVNGCLCVAVSILAPELLTVLSTHAYVRASRAIPPLALALVAIGSSQVTALGISLTNRTRYIAQYSAAAAAMNIALCWVLIPPFGIIGAAWATTIAYSLLTTAYFFRSQRLWPVDYEAGRCLAVIGLTVLFSLGTLFTPSHPSWAWAPLKLLYVLVFGGALAIAGAIGLESAQRLRHLVADPPASDPVPPSPLDPA